MSVFIARLMQFLGLSTARPVLTAEKALADHKDRERQVVARLLAEVKHNYAGEQVNGLTPRIILRGENAELLCIAEREVNLHYGPQSIHSRVLARSKAGAFFMLGTVYYLNPKEAEAQTIQFRFLEEDEAQKMFYESEDFTPAAFEAIFKKRPPPQNLEG